MRFQHIKDSWKNSHKPFESATGKFSFSISIIAGLVCTSCITENWGNRMIWWALGIPGAVWLIYFVWNLAKSYHRLHKDRSPELITVLLFLTVGFSMLLLVQHFTIKQLRTAPLSYQDKQFPVAALPSDEIKRKRGIAVEDDERGNFYQSNTNHQKACEYFAESYINFFECNDWDDWDHARAEANRYVANKIANHEENSSEVALGNAAFEAIKNAQMKNSSTLPKEAADFYNMLTNRVKVLR